MALPNNPTQAQVVKAIKDLESAPAQSTDVQVNGTSITSGGVANIVTESAYNASTNKIATKNDITKANAGLSNVANERQYSANNPPPYPVTSVNGQTGAVTGLATSNPNLLINSNFAINQRNGYIFKGTAPFYSDAGRTNQIGITDARVGYVTVESISGNAANITISYTPDNGKSWITQNGFVPLSSCTSGYVAAASGWTYTVDRWRISGSGSSYNVATNTVTLANSAFDQIIELPTYLKGKTVTASINVSSISGSFTLKTYDGTTTTTQTLANGTVSKTITIGNSATSLRVFVFGTGSFVPNWVKLEVGDVATEYTPPLIAEELPKCQYYFKRFTQMNNPTVGATTNVTEFRVPLGFVGVMRTIPTISFYKCGIWSGDPLYWNQDYFTTCTIEAVVTNGYFTGGQLIATLETAVNAWTKYIFRIEVDGYLDFDAEL